MEHAKSTKQDEPETFLVSMESSESALNEQKFLDGVTLRVDNVDDTQLMQSANAKQERDVQFTNFCMIVVCLIIFYTIIWIGSIALVQYLSNGVIVAYVLSCVCSVAFFSCVGISWCIYHPKNNCN